MTGLEVYEAICAGLEGIELCYKAWKHIKAKINDAKALEGLKLECTKTIQHLEKARPALSRDAQRDADELRNSIQAIMVNIEAVENMSQLQKRMKFYKVWNSEFTKDFNARINTFKNKLEVEANGLLQTINLGQISLQASISAARQDIDRIEQTVITRDAGLPQKLDALLNELHNEFGDCDVNDKLRFLEEIGYDLQLQLEAVQRSHDSAAETLKIVLTSVRETEKLAENLTNNLSSQNNLLLELRSNIQHSFHQIRDILEHFPRIVSSWNLCEHSITLQQYAKHLISSNIYLPAIEIWDQIHQVAAALSGAYKLDISLPTAPIEIFLTFNTSLYNYTFWTSRLGECINSLNFASWLIFSQITFQQHSKRFLLAIYCSPCTHSL
jgi:hypothetical protein